MASFVSQTAPPSVRAMNRMFGSACPRFSSKCSGRRPYASRIVDVGARSGADDGEASPKPGAADKTGRAHALNMSAATSSTRDTVHTGRAR